MEINGWDNAAEAISDVYALTAQIKRSECEMNEELAQVTAKYKEAMEEKLKLKTDIEAALKRFATKHKSELSGKRSREFIHGKMGFRKSSAIVIKGDADEVIEALKSSGMEECVRITAKIDKDELAKYSDGTLKRIGAKRVERDKYFLDIYYEELGMRN